MRLALLCLIGLIGSARSVSKTDGIDLYPSGKFDIALDNSTYHKRTPDFNSTDKPAFGPTKSKKPISNSTDSSKAKASKPTSKLTTKLTSTTMMSSNATANQTMISTTTNSTVSWTPVISNHTEPTAVNLTTETLTEATTKPSGLTSVYLRILFALTVLFMIGSIGALYYLKVCSENLNPKKGDSPPKRHFSTNRLLVSN